MHTLHLWATGIGMGSLVLLAIWLLLLLAAEVEVEYEDSIRRSCWKLVGVLGTISCFLFLIESLS